MDCLNGKQLAPARTTRGVLVCWPDAYLSIDTEGCAGGDKNDVVGVL